MGLGFSHPYMDLELPERLAACARELSGIGRVLAWTLYHHREVTEDGAEDGAELKATGVASSELVRMVDAVEVLVAGVRSTGGSFSAAPVSAECLRTTAALEGWRVSHLFEIQAALEDFGKALSSIASRHEASPLGRLAAAGISAPEIREPARDLRSVAFKLGELLSAKSLTVYGGQAEEGPQGAPAQVSAEAPRRPATEARPPIGDPSQEQ